MNQACEICRTTRNLDRHHVVSRGMGGSKSPEVQSEGDLITLCRTCHRNIHEGGWSLERSDDGLRVVDSRTGTEIMRRRRSSDFDASTFLALMDRLESSLSEALTLIPYFDDEQLVEAFRDCQSLGRRSWILQAAILHEAQERSVYGDRSLEAISRRFEISLNMAEKYARVWRTFFAEGQEIFNVEEIFLSEASWYVVAATESPDPNKWLAYAQDKKAERPGYSISDFRREIQQAVQADGIVLGESLRDMAVAAPEVHWTCPWLRPYCTRSGLPLPATECRCEV